MSGPAGPPAQSPDPTRRPEGQGIGQGLGRGFKFGVPESQESEGASESGVAELAAAAALRRVQPGA